MLHASTRVLGLMVALLVAAASALTFAAPARAADKDLGWLRFEPAKGANGDVMSVLTQAPCPGGEAIIVKVTGPNVATDGSVGNMVGVTQIKILKPTLSGQLLVPLSFTFRDWIGVNSVQIKPNAPYSLTLVCRDLIRGSETFGSFTGQVVFDGKGNWRAIAEAAKPFDTELKPEDPLGGVLPTPEASASTGATPSPAASNPTDEPTDGASAAPSESAPDITDPVPDAEVTADPVAAPATAGADSAGSGRFLLIGLGLLALVGALWGLIRSRRPEPRYGAHEPERDRVASR